MAKKNKGLIIELTLAPWWFSVILSAILYFVVIPLFMSNTSPPMNIMLEMLGNMFSVFLLFIAILSWARGLKAQRLFDRQKDLNSIRDLSWRQFESLLAEYYRRADYYVEENTSDGPDGGIDLNLFKQGERHLVQCKQYRKQKVGVPVIREMYGVLMSEEASSMTIVSSGTFTTEAIRFAQNKPLTLISGEELTQMIQSVQANQPIPSPVSQSTIEMHCPNCQSKLVLRKAKRGIKAGRQFYGCGNFPRCRYTQDLKY